MNPVLFHSNPAAQEFARGGDLLDMIKASRELTHACAVRGAWVTAAECQETILGRADLTTCRSCRHGQDLALSCPGGVRVALPPTSPLPDLGERPPHPKPAPAARLCGETQPVAAPTPGPGPMTTETSAVGGPGTTGISGTPGLVPAQALPRTTRPKTDPAEKRRRKAEWMRRYRADATLRRREERERAKAEREAEDRRQAKLKAAAKAKREREARDREQGRRIRLLADTLAYLIPRHGGRGTLGLRFTRLIFVDRTGVDMGLEEFRALCRAAFLHVSGRGSLVIEIDNVALAFAGLDKEAA